MGKFINPFTDIGFKSQPYFKNRSVYYVARSISRQGEPGPEWRYDVKAVYLIALLNFKREDISNEFRTDVALMDMKQCRGWHRMPYSKSWLALPM